MCFYNSPTLWLADGLAMQNLLPAVYLQPIEDKTLQYICIACKMTT